MAPYLLVQRLLLAALEKWRGQKDLFISRVVYRTSNPWFARLRVLFLPIRIRRSSHSSWKGSSFLFSSSCPSGRNRTNNDPSNQVMDWSHGCSWRRFYKYIALNCSATTISSPSTISIRKESYHHHPVPSNEVMNPAVILEEEFTRILLHSSWSINGYTKRRAVHNTSSLE